LDNELINDLRNLKYSSINDYNDLHLKFVKIASEKYELVEKNFDNMEKITGLEAENEAIKKAREYYENTISSKRQLIKKYHNKLEDYKSENAALVAENLKLKQELKSSEFTGELAKNAYNRAHAEKEALALENADFRTALEFYADKEKWSDFISNGGVFDEQDGDFVEAFNAMNGDMDQGETARDVLQKHSAGKGEG
jgi:chromosome segregation ATPase